MKDVEHIEEQTEGINKGQRLIKLMEKKKLNVPNPTDLIKSLNFCKDQKTGKQCF